MAYRATRSTVAIAAPAIMLTGGRGRRGGGATEINTVMPLRFLTDGEGFGWAHRGGSLTGYPLPNPRPAVRARGSALLVAVL